MAVGKEIRTQISSIKNTQKITRAIEMVAASKMRKTKDRMQATRPYSKKISQIIKHLAHANPEYKHPFLISREVKRVGVIVITSDRGLCGGLNSNLFRTILKDLAAWEKDDVDVDICTIGTKGSSFFATINANVIGQIGKLGDTPHLNEIVGLIKIMLDAYSDGTIDELYVVSNEFVNTMTQKPIVEKLIPIAAADLDDDSEYLFGNKHWDYLYEPDAKEVLDTLLTRYIESIVYQGLVENNACEQSARMVAMKNATDNAGDLIDDLQLIYNKARQTAITSELADIVGGAAAVS
jgi:F-type H+-transporting ATPase subunit gamma